MCEKNNDLKREDYISWDEYFMGIAMLSAERSKDPNTVVGACIVSEDNRILSAGIFIESQNYDNQIIVNELPDDTNGKWVSDYYSIDGEYIYDPKPRPVELESEPTTDEVLNVLLGIGGDI